MRLPFPMWWLLVVALAAYAIDALAVPSPMPQPRPCVECEP